MIPAGALPGEGLKTVLEIIRSYVRDRVSPDQREYKAIVGFLFARPQCKIAKDTIIPSLNYYDQKSGESIDLFCFGYTKGTEKESSAPLAIVDGQAWYFDDRAFNEAVQEIEAKTKWRYSGEVDLLIANVELIDHDAGHHVNFSRVLSFDIEKMEKIGAIETTNKLFQDLFNFAENIKTNDPVAEFSDKMGSKLLKKSMWAAFWDKIKQLLFVDLKGMPDFAVRDVTK